MIQVKCSDCKREHGLHLSCNEYRLQDELANAWGEVEQREFFYEEMCQKRDALLVQVEEMTALIDKLQTKVASADDFIFGLQEGGGERAAIVRYLRSKTDGWRPSIHTQIFKSYIDKIEDGTYPEDKS